MTKVYVVAEAGVNHNGSLQRALELVDIAGEAGADAVKFQTFSAQRLVGLTTPKCDYQRQDTSSGNTQFEMLRGLELSEESHARLVERCKEREIDFLSTPFDVESVDLLCNRFGVPRLKLPSGEATNPVLLLAAAQVGKPVILSTGMCNIGEVESALGVLAVGYLRLDGPPTAELRSSAFSSTEGQSLLKRNVTLLHCTSSYPAQSEEVNLRAMDTLRAAFGLEVGYSDHTLGIAVSIAAAARGAALIEKHFTLDRSLPGPDHTASLEPRDLAEMIRSIRIVERALGSELKAPTPAELRNRLLIRRKVVASTSIKPGEPFSEANLALKRSPSGPSAMRYWELVGRPAQRAYMPDEPIIE